MSNQNATLRQQLLQALGGDQSHIDFKSAVSDFPLELGGVKPPGAPHSAWELMEHLRIAQHDILEFSRNPKHKSPPWPQGYWPEAAAPSSKKAWDASIVAFQKDAKEMSELIQDPSQDLYKPIEGGDGQTLLREALVLATHNSYHLGQLMYLKKILTATPA
jgi:DinB superfamily